MEIDINTLVTALLGGGAVTFVGALVNGWKTLRSGARAREKEAVDDLAKWRDELDKRATRAELDRDFWRGVAGGYAYQLIRSGNKPDPPDPVAPSGRSG